MSSHDLLQTAVIFLLATVIAVPITKRFRLGAVLGYLVAGVVIGPAGLHLIAEPRHAAEISEFGVVLMLFVIGLELSPKRLWVMRQAVFGTGLLQVLASSLVLGAIVHLKFGLTSHAAAIVGGSLALSSTAFGLQILAERKETSSAYGRQAFAILLFQDVAAIPLMAAVPLLAPTSSSHGVDPMAVVRTVTVIVAVIIGGRYLLRPVFRFVARANAAEVSTATALLVVMGTTLLMERFNVSVTLGAFLAGVLLADSEYRHELQSDLEPFKGLLLGLFFMSVGMSMQIDLLPQAPLTVLGLTFGLLLVKGLLLWPLGLKAGGLNPADSLRLAVLLASGSEFAFVVLRQATQHELIATQQGAMLVLAITLSMALTPLLVAAIAKLIGVRKKQAPQRPFDAITVEHPRVIIAGYGRMGQIVARILRARNIPFVALDHSVEQLNLSHRFSNHNDIFYGDPARPELLRAAQADKAEVFVLATDDPESSLRVTRVVRRQYPHLKIVARARNRQHVWRLMDLGIDQPVRETLYSSLHMSRKALEALGLSAQEAAAEVERFRLRDAALLKLQYLVYDDEAKLVQTTREALADLNSLFEADATITPSPANATDDDAPLAAQNGDQETRNV